MGTSSNDVRDYRRLLKPLVRAYVLGYLSSTIPQIFSLLAALLQRKTNHGIALSRLYKILRSAAAINRFPALCGVLVGGSTLLKFPLRVVLTSLLTTLYQTRWRRKWQVDNAAIERLSRFLAAFVAATAGFALLNSGQHGRSQGELAHAQVAVPPERSTTVSSRLSDLEKTPEPSSPKPPSDTADPAASSDTTAAARPRPPALSAEALGATPLALSPSALAGKTLDLTLFATVHALSVLLSTIWPPRAHRSRLANALSRSTLPLLFTFSSATIMHAWFYAPLRLPRGYVSWISRFAHLDPRLLEALRQARMHNWVYGADTGLAPLLGSMARDHGLPEEWGDPAKTIPVPCELVHQGAGKSCERHSALRFWRAWAEAAKMYVPLRLAVVVLRWLRRRRDMRVLRRLLTDALKDAARSSAFLAAFISLFYYGVCLARTRLGPRLFPSHVISPQMWDAGLCVRAGCLLCGLSFLVLPEKGSRRADVVFFVLPRALGVWFPRRYERRYIWREGAAFAVSAAVVLTAAQEGEGRVRGWLGRVLRGVLAV